MHIGQLSWSPAGSSILLNVSSSTNFVCYRLSPNVAAAAVVPLEVSDDDEDYLQMNQEAIANNAARGLGKEEVDEDA